MSCNAVSMIAVRLNPLRLRYANWDEVGTALGVAGARTLVNHRGPPKDRPKPTKQLIRSVDALFEQTFPFPLPRYQQLIRRRLTAAKRKPGDPLLLETIEEIEGIVADAAPGDPLHAAGLCYLLYLALHARAVLNGRNRMFGDAVKWRAALADAVQALANGRAVIAKALSANSPVPGDASLRELDTWLFLNWVVAVGSNVPDDPEPDPAAYVATLKAGNALACFRNALVDLPHEWRVPYNGLDVASRLRAADADLRLFYRRLIEFDSGFEDLDHTPGEVQPISKNPGMAHFRLRALANPSILK